MSKKVLFVVTSLELGGVETVNITIANELAKEDDVTIFTNYSSTVNYDLKAKHCYEPFSFVDKVLLYANVFLDRLANKFGTTLQASWNARSKTLFKHLKSNAYDTIIVSLAGVSAFSIEKIKKLQPNAKIILWLHADYQYYFGQDGVMSYSTKLLVKNMRQADTVVTLGETAKNDYAKLSHNVVKINNPLSFPKHSLSCDLDKQIISITSRYEIQYKGLDYLVKIAKTIPDNWQIAIAGSGSTSEIKVFHELIKAENVENKLILRGALYGKELFAHYADSSIYIMTSRSEGFGMVLVEAMSFGLPIIAFDQSGSQEVLGASEYGILIENGDITAFSEVLNHMISSKAQREIWRKKSENRVTAFYVDHIIEEWRKII